MLKHHSLHQGGERNGMKYNAKGIAQSLELVLYKQIAYMITETRAQEQYLSVVIYLKVQIR